MKQLDFYCTECSKTLKQDDCQDSNDIFGDGCLDCPKCNCQVFPKPCIERECDGSFGEFGCKNCPVFDDFTRQLNN